MSDAIALLESLGCATTSLPATGWSSAVAPFAPDVRAALLARDSDRLVRLLGGRPFMACSIMAPDSDEPLPQEQPDTPDDLPAEDDVRAA